MDKIRKVKDRQIIMNELDVFKKRHDLLALEEELSEFDQVELPLLHDFMGGIYIRTVMMPKGSLVIGRRHRYKTCNFLLSGELSLYMSDDGPVERFEGPHLFESDANVKKMLYMHTDCVFSTFHPSSETEVKELEKIFIIPEDEYQKQIEQGENTK